MKLDLHVHSIYSGHALGSGKQIIKTASDKGAGFAITDHDCCKAWKIFSAEAKKQSVPLVLGEEIKVFRCGDLVGELIGLFMNTPVQPGEIYEVIDSLRKQDALISIAHPFDILRAPLLTGFRLKKEIFDLVDAVEVFNGRSWLSRFNKQAQEFSGRNSKPFTAGSDAHFPSEVGNAGLELDCSSLEEARKLIKDGNAKVFGKRTPITTHFKVQLVKQGLLK